MGCDDESISFGNSGYRGGQGDVCEVTVELPQGGMRQFAGKKNKRSNQVLLEVPLVFCFSDQPEVLTRGLGNRIEEKNEGEANDSDPSAVHETREIKNELKDDPNGNHERKSLFEKSCSWSHRERLLDLLSDGVLGTVGIGLSYMMYSLTTSSLPPIGEFLSYILAPGHWAEPLKGKQGTDDIAITQALWISVAYIAEGLKRAAAVFVKPVGVSIIALAFGLQFTPLILVWSIWHMALLEKAVWTVCYLGVLLVFLWYAYWFDSY
ncbi:MAG: hypothetical protein QME76_07240 [Bacillota bacterium]|nr:hypothetical protein [Bacillota bacterium]